MRKAGLNCIMLCKMQGNLFAHYYKYCDCSPLVFVRRFMTSKLAERFDDLTVLLEVSSEKTFVDEINAQYGITHHGKKTDKDEEVLFWTGYIYRYWCYVYEISSKKLVQHLNPGKLFRRYYLYHSMDLQYAIERIAEEEKIYLPPRKSIEEILDELIKSNS